MDALSISIRENGQMSNSHNHHTPPLPEPGKDRKVTLKTVIAGIVGALFIGFLIQNSEDTPVEFLWWSASLPRWLTLLIAALAGIMIWELASYLRRRRR
tara:strand:+ start:244 stop:540 length:297 start_codon:yes stop_codon:yes gene_type:complete